MPQARELTSSTDSSPILQTFILVFNPPGQALFHSQPHLVKSGRISPVSNRSCLCFSEVFGGEKFYLLPPGSIAAVTQVRPPVVVDFFSHSESRSVLSKLAFISQALISPALGGQCVLTLWWALERDDGSNLLPGPGKFSLLGKQDTIKTEI